MSLTLTLALTLEGSRLFKSVSNPSRDLYLNPDPSPNPKPHSHPNTHPLPFATLTLSLHPYPKPTQDFKSVYPIIGST